MIKKRQHEQGNENGQEKAKSSELRDRLNAEWFHGLNHLSTSAALLKLRNASFNGWLTDESGSINTNV